MKIEIDDDTLEEIQKRAMPHWIRELDAQPSLRGKSVIFRITGPDRYETMDSPEFILEPLKVLRHWCSGNWFVDSDEELEIAAEYFEKVAKFLRNRTKRP
jgi:hypothetical protein